MVRILRMVDGGEVTRFAPEPLESVGIGRLIDPSGTTDLAVPADDSRVVGERGSRLRVVITLANFAIQ
jgi:hypothetical protein